MRKITEVLRLHCNNHLSKREIARAIGVSRSTVQGSGKNQSNLLM